ncbi:aspartate-semialdehyde dehydrogenase [Candidatus Protochlamydia naegleriophila]|uniref:Aspartate-semialdehyde dehydrogenase n=1 Tax=Candidatus Protochlamydia naegleriophila TaxID=389348 RepID=A0A0U5EQI4_9BACT|nr:aspartate-semialdehyde dehydrogenase [Candidatus Protochlamydia naegleriophila]CUI16403.1 aspartate-semialdehyde dehydrogenase [Candidatus Protochlamydia naegleriophila]
MMSGDFFFRNKIRVAILGATGCVGQKFVQLLDKHPWFEITALCASERSVGKRYKDAVNWLLQTPLPASIAEMEVLPCSPALDCQLVFSGLDSSVAGSIETEFAQAGYLVVSNSRNHRMDPAVPLVIGEVNADHLNLANAQSHGKGKIVTNPNCSVIGLVLALKPLMDQFGLEAVQVVTMQAISGAGYPGIASLDIFDNVIPYIDGEEDKLETEPLKILGRFQEQAIIPADFKISAQCNRVAVTDGHMACVSVKLKQKASQEALIQAWCQFNGEPQQLQLPSAPFQPIHYFDHPSYPQTRLHRSLDKEMAVSIGRLRPCPLLDYKFVVLSHNTMRGAAGSALLNAELLLKKGWIYWAT